MATKTLATIVIVFACIFFIPVAIGIGGALFGIIAGIFGGIVGLIGGIFGGIFGLIGGLFNWVFHWPFGFFHLNFCTMLLIVLVIVLAVKSRK